MLTVLLPYPLPHIGAGPARNFPFFTRLVS
jgi:hypothetical protein